jgi:hypothetical protein
MPFSTAVDRRRARPVAVAATAVCSAGLVVSLLHAPPAHAWGNGGDRPGPHKTVRNGYGTHDWVVDQAYRIAGGKARVGSWFDLATARQWSGYPDVYRTKGQHVFMESGHGRGAAEQASRYYVRTVRAYRAHKYQAASRAFGIMAHFVADVSMPYHSKRDPRSNRKEAERYEVYTSGLTRTRASHHDLCPQPTALPRVTDVRQVISDIASRSRTYYPRLSSILRSSGPAKATGITRAVLPLSCNNLAALLLSIPKASAMPAQVARVKVTLIRTKVRVGVTPKVDVTAYDARGNRIDGAMFRVDWPGRGHDDKVYTMPDGPVRTHGAAGHSPRKGTVRVTVSNPGATSSAAASGSARRAIVVAKKYRVMTKAQLKHARHKARKAGKPWRP